MKKKIIENFRKMGEKLTKTQKIEQKSRKNIEIYMKMDQKYEENH